MNRRGEPLALIENHPDFTQELPRKLLSTRAKGSQSHLREKPYSTRRYLWRVGSSCDLKRTHNLLYWGREPPTRPCKIAWLQLPLGFQPNGR